jgi:CarD family transcriptional regulator
MFQIGDLVVYGSEGVCRVDKIGVPDIPSINTEKLYYTLSPVYRDGKVFTPVDTAVFMRAVISKEEAQEIISRIPDMVAEIYENRNLRMLSDHYEALLKSYDCSVIAQLIKDVYAKREDVLGRGKSLGQTDERYVKQAEDMLFGEFAIALGIEKGAVKGYIEEMLKMLETNE